MKTCKSHSYWWLIVLVVIVLGGTQLPEPTTPESSQVVCPACNGKKMCKPPDLWIKSHPADDKEFPCPICGGSGVLYTEGEGVLRSEPVQ